ncbi:helix-turn-helix domain-containing protein [Nonomuraea pusilla]|uniref:Regulatory protein, luxR family n=1 Tax=Nonomuraea pusilla TaxID=46177 RepID=A0A1H7J9H4_9ACTN|nr:helix-turn-helix transcriptional regulator [Nonomuraea pusilla]SEK71363.1 regulatory protein, luxR family [Nonomuraea pusilla]
MPDSGWDDSLLPRERQVLALMAEGWSNTGIADQMYVSLRAVEKHVTSVFAKLGLPASAASNRRVLAVLHYLAANGPVNGAARGGGNRTVADQGLPRDVRQA